MLHFSCRHSKDIIRQLRLDQSLWSLTLRWNNGPILTSSSSFCFCRSSRIICSSSSSSLSLSLSEEYSSVSLRPCCRLSNRIQDYSWGRQYVLSYLLTEVVLALPHLWMSAISARSLSISSFSVAICLRNTCSREISSSCSVRISFSW